MSNRTGDLPLGARRSRTLRWRDCLEQILERGGGIEISIVPEADERTPSDRIDLVWRVRLHAIGQDEILVEMPGAMGRSFEIPKGSKIVGTLSVGQNRWMFHSQVIGTAPPGKRHSFPLLRLAPPSGVERCRRGSRDRISTARISLPEVRCWPLVDPVSAIPAELANRARIRELSMARQTGDQAPELEAILLPAVGPLAIAELANIGGGGVGLRFPSSEQIELDTRNTYWLRIDLRPWIPAPLTVSARLIHTFTDASQFIHAGFAFDFSHNCAHRDFVVEQMEKCMQRIAGESRNAA